VGPLQAGNPGWTDRFCRMLRDGEAA